MLPVQASHLEKQGFILCQELTSIWERNVISSINLLSETNHSECPSSILTNLYLKMEGRKWEEERGENVLAQSGPLTGLSRINMQIGMVFINMQTDQMIFEIIKSSLRILNFLKNILKEGLTNGMSSGDARPTAASRNIVQQAKLKLRILPCSVCGSLLWAHTIAWPPLCSPALTSPG